jgi:hypothetical protein
MTPAAISMLAFGAYLAGGGVLLLFVPEQLCTFLGLRPPGDSLWIRLCGMFFLYSAYYCFQAAHSEQNDFIRWSVLTRPLTLPILGACVLYQYENPTILVFGIVDAVAALWTWLALRPRAGSACTESGQATHPPRRLMRSRRSAAAW